MRALSTEGIAEALDARDAPFSYDEVGATRAIEIARPLELPARYDYDCRSFELGTGLACFRRARAALLSWQQFAVPWVTFHGGTQEAHVGQVVATSVRLAGLWFFNPCRVIYLDAPEDPDTGLAYGYGTLEGHVEAGEERFRLTRDPETDIVRYQILAFSRPAIWATKLGYPFARRTQARFAHASGRAMQAAAAGR